MLTNKHVIIALIVAPILAVLAWFAVGQWAGEKPAPARAGQAYPLVAASNCRWQSGECELKNTELSLRLHFDDAAALHLVSAHPLEIVLVSIVDPALAESPAPRALQAVDDSKRHWRIDGLGVPAPRERIRLAAGAAGSQFYGEAASTFAQTGAAADTPEP